MSPPLLWSGPTDGSGLHGVALAIPKRLRSTLLSWKPINSRLLTSRFNHRHGKLTVIVAYAPTELATEAEKDLFYDQLQSLIDAIPPHDITIVLTVANASLSRPTPDEDLPSVTGPVFIDAITNDNGQRLLQLCMQSDLSVMDTWFPRKNIHHWTWYSNDGRTRKALDHILVSTR